MARLVVNREEADLVTHELTRDIVTIGSAPLNHIVIDDPAVSAQHAILARIADSYRLKDLHSTNGTQVNGISITDAVLKDGDKIRFGSVVAVFCGTLQTLMKQMSSSLAGPLILPVPAQIERESPMATAQISPPSSRKLTLIAVAIAVLMIVGGAGWYLGHKREVAPEKLSGSSTQVERQIPIVNPTEDEAASKQPEPIATQPQRTAAKDLTVLPTEDVARAQQPQQEVGAKEGFHVSNSPTIAQPSIAPARGPWLFPDSSSRYLSANDLSSLSSADLWRARNEIFARKGYKFSRPRGIAFAQTLGNYYRGVDDDQDRVFNNMNQYERANVTLIRAIEKGR
jgi:pSer/pThr/pTyr-binding forkhead associated (FHA) protein